MGADMFFGVAIGWFLTAVIWPWLTNVKGMVDTIAGVEPKSERAQQPSAYWFKCFGCQQRRTQVTPPEVAKALNDQTGSWTNVVMCSDCLNKAATGEAA